MRTQWTLRKIERSTRRREAAMAGRPRRVASVSSGVESFSASSPSSRVLAHHRHVEAHRIADSDRAAAHDVGVEREPSVKTPDDVAQDVRVDL